MTGLSDGRLFGVELRSWLVVFAILAATAATLLVMGRVPICECGYVSLWYGNAYGPGNSQHLSDWYTPSHVIHGFLFYALFHWIARKRSLGFRLILSTVLECTWEVAENTETVIQRYREATISLDYFGDSVLNSMSDAGFMIVGFLLAARLPVAVTVFLAVSFEILTAVVIRDNLTLNVLMLLYPLDAVREWQAGAS
ncbi:hypothetical protein FP2506_15829 [Fulvimarina pelagi HTCC2506]|uniref:UPF0314 protein FP2506_15829 n=1 Tax=Fulvimarina pelagi HTCC2506 TaxID=314231 RepID=Q0G3B4_9HYPH|nr:DUF2585 domain-containing protein [Fulvimarina pelagi]EAU41917.1 hypothetical protein FP2506_15829 [Fulvimarina pelagi HTCC2506]